MEPEYPIEHSLRAIATFIVVALLLSALLSLVIGTTGGPHSPLIGLQVLSMVIPALTTALVRPWFGSSRVDWGCPPLAYVPLALLILPVVMHLAILPVVVGYEHRLPWQAWLTPQADGLIHSSAARALGCYDPDRAARSCRIERPHRCRGGIGPLGL